MQTAFTPKFKHVPTERAELSKINEQKVEKKIFPLIKKNKKDNLHTKNISSRVLKISVISLGLRTREVTDILNTFNEIYLVFTTKT